MPLAASDNTDLVLLAEEPVQFCPWCVLHLRLPFGAAIPSTGRRDHYPWYQWGSLELLTAMILGKWKVGATSLVGGRFATQSKGLVDGKAVVASTGTGFALYQKRDEE